MGNLLGKISALSALSQQFPPTSTFDPERDIPELAGKVIIVTGGNGGIGYHTVKQLLLKNAKVYLAARSPEKAAEALQQLKEETGGKEAVFLQLDLADLHSVQKAAEEFLNKEERLDILFNNAGVMAAPANLLTTQGFDLQFGTNVLGHYFFTVLLLPALERSTVYHKTKARVINVSSYVHEMAPGPTGIEWSSLKGGAERDLALKRLGSNVEWKLYGSSKLGNVYISNIFTRYHGEVITSCALHPGGLASDLQRHMPPWQRWVLNQFLYPVHFGALTQLWAGTCAEAEGVGGKYLFPWARLGRANPRAANEQTQDELKAWLDEQIKPFQVRVEVLSSG